MERIKGRYLVNENTGCWEWQLYKAAGGYGRITVNKEILYAHRYSYSAYHNIDISGLVIRHKCDNPSCINPAHLVAGTQKENVNDILLRGRRNDPKGENNYRAKFSDFEVEAMRILYEFFGLRNKDCAMAFGMSVTNANQILNYKKRLSCQINLPQKQNLQRSLANSYCRATLVK